MRPVLAWMAVPIFAVGGVFWWQHAQIEQLRAQIALQGGANGAQGGAVATLGGGGIAGTGENAQSQAPAETAARAQNPGAALRAAERRLIQDQYADIAAQLNLSPDKERRLKALLTERMEEVLDAEDAARRVGFAEGSADAGRAVALAVSGVEQEIGQLVGLAVQRQSGMGLTPAPVPDAPPALAPAAEPAVFNVLVQAPVNAAPAYADAAPAGDPYAWSGYYGYPYAVYPAGNIVAVGRTARPAGLVRQRQAVRAMRAGPAVTVSRGARVIVGGAVGRR